MILSSPGSTNMARRKPASSARPSATTMKPWPTRVTWTSSRAEFSGPRGHWRRGGVRPKAMALVKLSLILGGVLCLVCGCSHAPLARVSDLPARDILRFEVIEAPVLPVIDADSPDLAGNKYGFEGGSVVKEGGAYHLFVAEMAGDPSWARMRLAHWISPDAHRWRRASTLYETSGAMDTNDTRFSLWAPMPIFDERNDQWDLFYI